jgi:hypothetical protein
MLVPGIECILRKVHQGDDDQVHTGTFAVISPSDNCGNKLHIPADNCSANRAQPRVIAIVDTHLRGD